jgi:S-(hydroxymethyl)glutathione dehydrogenase/alcohol dehydrogenase
LVIASVKNFMRRKPHNLRAAILERLDAPLTIAEIEPGPVGLGQVLVKVLVSGLCGAQLQEIKGQKGNAKFLPHLLGHEGCGIVKVIGAGVTTVKVGDKVVMHWRKGDGIESDFPSYVFNGNIIRSGKVTTFNQYAIVSENRITTVDADTPNDFCALLGCGLSTALSVIVNEAKLRPGETVLIVGMGGVGACLVRAARMVGAGEIVVIDSQEVKRVTAHALGANSFFDAKHLPFMPRGPFDIIVDTSGSPKTIAMTLPLLGSGGRYVLISQPKPGEVIEILDAQRLFDGEGKSIIATQGGQFAPARDIPRYVKLMKARHLRFDDLITHRTKLDGLNDALDLMRAGRANRIMMDLWL